MVNINQTLALAHQFFTDGAYEKAMFLYSQLLADDKTNIEYQLYILFCDIGYENSQKAQTLHDYFTVAKNDNFDEAVKYVQDIISAYDGDNEKLMQILKDITVSNIETLNSISYLEFLELIENRGSFTQAYQDIMFSTKVAITSKDDMLDFISKLIENNFISAASTYLDSLQPYFQYDENITKLYSKLKESEQLDNNL
jgi:tetratricopeptide (TPR) repeat protein